MGKKQTVASSAEKNLKGGDELELKGWKSLLVGTDKDAGSGRFKNTEGPLVDLVDEDPKQAKNVTEVAVGYDESYNLIFANFDIMQANFKVDQDSYYGVLYSAYKKAIAKGNGIVLLKETNDDVLSSDSDDEQITYLPSGDVALMVSNTTNGADQYSINYECDLSKNILVTTSDGVEYCMPFDVVTAGRPDGLPSLLTLEQQYVAGIKNAPVEDRETVRPGKSDPREDPVTRDKIESGDIRNADMSSDDPRNHAKKGGSDGRTGITKELDFGSTSSGKGTGKTSSRTGSRRRTRSRSESEGVRTSGTSGGATGARSSGDRTGITSTYSDDSSSSSTTSTATRKSSRRSESTSEDALTFVPFTFTIGGS
jgi:hypothetical protein